MKHRLWWNGALVPMRSLSSQLLVPILASLLVLTTPVGTGSGVHASELLHPLLPHAHLIDGRVIFAIDADATQAPSTASTPGPALGAGSGAEAGGLGLAIGPALSLSAAPIVAGPPDRLTVLQVDVPAEFRAAPEDPPPNFA